MIFKVCIGPSPRFGWTSSAALAPTTTIDA
jgi:hypothetical protein